MNIEKKVCIVSPMPPPYGGMAIQAEKLQCSLANAGWKVTMVRTNSVFPQALAWVSNVPLLRTLVNTVLFLFSLRAALRNNDMVYFLTGFVSFFFWITYPGVILIKAYRKKVILSVRGGGAARFLSRWKWAVRPLLRRSDLITAPSGFLETVFKEVLGLKLVVVSNIADLNQFHFIDRPHLKPRLIVTRSLEPIYNVGCVIRAFQKVKTRFQEATLTIVGDGSERQMLENLTSELGLSAAVTFHGRVAHDQIQALYKANDISINASNVDNLPGTILEAFACGLPIVSTNAGGIPYMVEDGVTGLLVNCNDCDALADRVIELLENAELSQKLIVTARNECEKYIPDRVVDTLVPLLVKVAKRETV